MNLHPSLADCLKIPSEAEQGRVQELMGEASKSKISTLEPRSELRRGTNSIYSTEGRSSHGKSETERRRSTRSILATLCHQNIDASHSHSEAYASKGPTAKSSTCTSLSKLLSERGKIGTKEADKYFKQLIHAVQYLHRHGIAHRDLNPEHILLGADGRLKIIGFDHAEYFHQPKGQEKRIETSSKQCGSLAYLAPEVFAEKYLDPRPVDMWALAIIYMEMRTGKLLWNYAAEGGDPFYDRYLQARFALWGYRPIENLENVRTRR